MLFTLAYYSNGAFNFDHVYNMPVYLRNFYMKQLEETKAQEAELVKTNQKGSKPTKR